MSDELLSVDEVGLSFGGIRALNGASLTVSEGEVVGLIGPNGAGKTTLFNVISGLYRPDSGRITVDGSSVTGSAPHRIAAKGIYRTFQNLAIIESCTALENVMMGASVDVRFPVLSSIFRPGSIGKRERSIRERAMACLDACGISSVAAVPPSSLPYGTLKRIELARALMAEPRLIMLDELAAGLMAVEVEDLAELLAELRATHDFALLLVEHHMDFVMGLSDRVVVLESGRTLASGTPEAVRNDPAVLAAYLGTDG